MPGDGLASELNTLKQLKATQGSLNTAMQFATVGALVSSLIRDAQAKGYVVEITGGYNLNADAKIADIVGVGAGAEITNGGVSVKLGLNLYGGLNLATGVQYSDLDGKIHFGADTLKVEGVIPLSIRGLPLSAELAVGTPKIGSNGLFSSQEFAISMGVNIGPSKEWAQGVAEAGAKGGLVLGIKITSPLGFVEEGIAPALSKNWSKIFDYGDNAKTLSGVDYRAVVDGMHSRTSGNYLFDFAREVALLSSSPTGDLELQFQSDAFGANAYPFMGGIGGLTGASVGSQFVHFEKTASGIAITAKYANQITSEGLAYYAANGKIPSSGYTAGALDTIEVMQFDAKGNPALGAGGLPVRC